MKKLVCVLLVLACSFALFACGKDKEPEIRPEDTLLEIVNTSEPTKIVTMSSYDHIASGMIYRGVYTTTITADGFDFDYEYQQKAAVVPGADPNGTVETKTGSIIFANGLYSTDGGETWKSDAPDTGALQISLNLKKEYLGEYTVSMDGKSLTTVINAENAKKILGLDIASNEINVKITTNGKYLTQINISYETETAEVTIDTSYAYIAVEGEETPAE